MKANMIRWISVTVTINMTIIVLLVTFSSKKKQISDFHRVWIPEFASLEKVYNISKPTGYIAGLSDRFVYIGDREEVTNLLILDILKERIQQVKIHVEGAVDSSFNRAYLKVDSCCFYIKNGAKPVLFRGETGQWIARPVSLPEVSYSVVIPLSSNSYAIRTLIDSGNTGIKKRVLGKIKENSEQVYLNTALPESQEDGYFSTRGTFRYSRERQLFTYTYLYRNQYLVIDTSLNLFLRKSTIAPLDRQKLKPMEIRKDLYTLASPTTIINNSSQLCDKWLFVHSNVNTKNDILPLREAMVIDVYDIIAGEYRFSFCLRHDRDLKANSFMLDKSRLAAVFGQYVFVNHLSPNWWKDDLGERKTDQLVSSTSAKSGNVQVNGRKPVIKE